MLNAITTVPPADAAEVSWHSSSSGLSSQERLLALVIYTQASRRDAAECDINASFEEISKLRAEVKNAIEQARAAERDSGFWSDLADFFGGDLATLAGAIAAVAAVVATGGAAAAVLAVVASAASFAAEHAEELGIPPELAMGIAIAASVAGLACGNGQGLIRVTEDMRQVAGGLKSWSLLTQGVTKGIGAGAGAVSGHYAGDALDYRADARRAEGRQTIVSADIDEALDSMRFSLQQQLDAARATSNINQGAQASNSAILNNFAGAA